MNFTDRLWREGKPLLDRMIEHPFNKELASGTLPYEVFCHYLQQDELYIKDYTRILRHLAERADEPNLKRDLLNFADEGYWLEKEMHDVYFQRYDIAPAQEKNLACTTYSEFLENCAHKASFAVALSALLPCFWYYWKVGLSLLYTSNTDNPYHDWITLYSGDDFARQVQCLLDHTERRARQESVQEQKAMRDTFITSSILELAFWDGIYHSAPQWLPQPLTINSGR